MKSACFIKSRSVEGGGSESGTVGGRLTRFSVLLICFLSSSLDGGPQNLLGLRGQGGLDGPSSSLKILLCPAVDPAFPPHF